MMKRLLVSPTILVVLAVSALAFSGDPAGTTPSSDSDAAQLRRQIADLKAQINTLEKRLDRLEKNPPKVFVEPPGFQQMPKPVPNTRPRLEIPPVNQEHPRIWGERHINGWTFYIVPCAEKPAALQAAAGPACVLQK